MQQRPYCFLVVFLLMFSRNVFSQRSDSVVSRKFYVSQVISQAEPIRLQNVRPDFYSSNLSFFCRKELEIEKNTKIPFRFRLGSTDYTNYLESKPNARKPGN